VRGVVGAPAQVAALELFVDVLSRADDELEGDDFYSRLAEVVCRLGEMDRAIIFRYDDALRRVRVAGSHGIELETFGDVNVTAASTPLARRALSQDRVLEIRKDFDRQVPAEFAHLLTGTPLVCTPMAAAGRSVGVIFSDRGNDTPPLRAEQRDALWMLGKLAALASVARIATVQRTRARQLEERIDLAREIHESVVQRLFGVSLALTADADELAADARDRCAAEVQLALRDLRAALQRPLSRESRPTVAPLRDELQRLAREHPILTVDMPDELEVPAPLEPVLQSILVEAIRNAGKHAEPTAIAVHVREVDGTLELEISNDGVHGRPRTTGMGLRLAAFEALQAGGFVEFGARTPGTWQVRLVVPAER